MWKINEEKQKKRLIEIDIKHNECEMDRQNEVKIRLKMDQEIKLLN